MRRAEQRALSAHFGYDCDILVLGIGNLLWADEGFGIRALEGLNEVWRFGPKVRLLDGGTQGLYLLPYVEGCRKLLIFDAVDYGLPPGTLKIVEDGEVPAFMGAKKMSLHQTGFQEVLAVAALRGWQPDKVVLIGIQPDRLDDYGGSLSEVVKARLTSVIEIGCRYLADWHAGPIRRAAPLRPEQRITLDSLAMPLYEQGRPGPELACRFGDGRFLSGAA